MSPEYELEFDIIREGYYSDYRYQFFNTLTKVFTFLGLSLMLTGAYLDDNKTISLIIEIIGSFLLITNTVLDFQSNAVFWKNMSANFSKIHEEYLKGKGSWTSKDINEFNAKVQNIQSNDKNFKRVLAEKAHNSTNHQIGCNHKYDFDISWYKWITANFISWDAGNLRYIDKSAEKQ